MAFLCLLAVLGSLFPGAANCGRDQPTSESLETMEGHLGQKVNELVSSTPLDCITCYLFESFIPSDCTSCY